MRDAIFTAPSVRPSRRSGDRSNRQRSRRPGDCWEGLSTDLIERFIDVMCVEVQLSRSLRRGYRADLSAFDRWMQQTTGRTLVSARPGDLHSYIRQRTAEGLLARRLDRLLASMHHFYSYLRESGCRDDHPASRLPLRSGASAHATSPRVLQIALFSRAHC